MFFTGDARPPNGVSRGVGGVEFDPAPVVFHPCTGPLPRPLASIPRARSWCRRRGSAAVVIPPTWGVLLVVVGAAPLPGGERLRCPALMVAQGRVVVLVAEGVRCLVPAFLVAPLALARRRVGPEVHPAQGARRVVGPARMAVVCRSRHSVRGRVHVATMARRRRPRDLFPTCSPPVPGIGDKSRSRGFGGFGGMKWGGRGEKVEDGSRWP